MVSGGLTSLKLLFWAITLFWQIANAVVLSHYIYYYSRPITIAI